VSPKVSQKLQRLVAILAERSGWATELAQVTRMRHWVLEAEQILSGSWAQPGEAVRNETVGERLDVWRQTLTGQLTNGTLSEVEQTCLSEFLRVLSNLRPYLVQCYNRKDFPSTNNEMERCIRGLKTQYRRVSGRKNWNSYLLRYGRSVAYAAWWEQDAAHQQQLEQRAARLDRTRLSRVPTGNQSRSERAAQALSLPSQTSAVSRFPGGSLGCCHFNVTFALTVFKPIKFRARNLIGLFITSEEGRG
jgi:hypothetical protein